MGEETGVEEGDDEFRVSVVGGLDEENGGLIIGAMSCLEGLDVDDDHK